uniref:Putative secreted protein n=1 Tax=Ixodes ricinus TaxID=34613 RepID=A0A6B0U065_IXORI
MRGVLVRVVPAVVVSIAEVAPVDAPLVLSALKLPVPAAGGLRVVGRTLAGGAVLVQVVAVSAGTHALLRGGQAQLGTAAVPVAAGAHP